MKTLKYCKTCKQEVDTSCHLITSRDRAKQPEAVSEEDSRAAPGSAIPDATKRRYFDVIYCFGLHRSALDASILEIPLQLEGYGRSTATGSTVEEVCARALEWLQERDWPNVAICREEEGSL